MEAKVKYGDLKGTVAADFADNLRGGFSDIAEYFKLDTKRFELIGLSFRGAKDCAVILICVDVEKSENNRKEHIVEIWNYPDDSEIFDKLFKRLNIVLFARGDERYASVDSDSEADFEDLHRIEEDE